MLKTAKSTGHSKIKPKEGSDPLTAIVPGEQVKTGNARRRTYVPCAVDLVWDEGYETLRIGVWKTVMDGKKLKAVFQTRGVVYK